MLYVGLTGVTDVTFQLFEFLYWWEPKKAGNNFGILREDFKNGPNEFYRICVPRDVAIIIC